MWQRVGNHKWLATTRLNHEDLESYKFAVECLERIGHRLTAVDSSGFNQGKFTASQALTIFDKVACIGRSALIKSSDGRVVRHKRVQYLRLTLSPDGIACLHKLRFFNFSTVVNAPQVVETLSSSAPFLEHLACRRCEGYLDRPLIKLVQSCKRLTYFNVSGCPKVSAALLMAVNEEVASRTRELTLGVGGCGILEHQLGTIVTSPLLSMSQTYRTVPRMPMTFSESDR